VSYHRGTLGMMPSEYGGTRFCPGAGTWSARVQSARIFARKLYPEERTLDERFFLPYFLQGEPIMRVSGSQRIVKGHDYREDGSSGDGWPLIRIGTDPP
jgi:hypothetical protein